MEKFNIKDAALGVVYDRNGEFWNSKWNLHPDVLAQYDLPENVTFTDSTIREGEEAPHVVYRLADKLKIARLLDTLGVDELDCGFGSVNQDHLEFLRAMGSEGLKIKKSAIARIDLPGFEKGIEKVIEAGADIVLCGFYPTPIEGYGWLDYCKRVENAVSRSVEAGMFTAFWTTCTRWEERYVLDLYKSAIAGGANRIKTAGGGVLTVPAYKRMVRLLRDIAGDSEVGVHVHNNYGTATACTLASVEAGASNVETSVNGLADGAGLAPFEEVVMALKVMYGLNIRINTHKIMALSQLVQEISGMKVQPHKPLVGKSVFVETPDTHIEAILRARRDKIEGPKRPKGFIDPELIGQKSSLLFGPSALGGKSVELKGMEMGIRLGQEQVHEILDVMRNKLRQVNALSEDDVESIIRAAAK